MDEKRISDMEMDDLLWQKFLLGDDKSFDRLYDKFVRILFLYGLQFTYDRELVKDCIQDVFLQVFKTRTQLYHVKNVGVFLHVALKNRIFNALKKEKIHARYITASAFSEIDDYTAEQKLESLEEEQQNRSRMEKMMKLLTPQQRKVIHYKYIEDLSLEEISVRLKINYQSVQNILQRAIKKIKTHFVSYKK